MNVEGNISSLGTVWTQDIWSLVAGLQSVLIESVEMSGVRLKVNPRLERSVGFSDWYNQNKNNFNSNLALYALLVSFFVTSLQ